MNEEEKESSEEVKEEELGHLESQGETERSCEFCDTLLVSIPVGGEREDLGLSGDFETSRFCSQMCEDSATEMYNDV